MADLVCIRCLFHLANRQTIIYSILFLHYLVAEQHFLLCTIAQLETPKWTVNATYTDLSPHPADY